MVYFGKKTPDLVWAVMVVSGRIRTPSVINYICYYSVILY